MQLPSYSFITFGKLPRQKKLPDTVTARLWETYWQEGKPEDFDRLYRHYTPLINLTVEQGMGLKGQERQEALVDGVEGLWQAIEKWQPDQYPNFHGFARAAIKRAVIGSFRQFNGRRLETRQNRRTVSLNEPDVAMVAEMTLQRRQGPDTDILGNPRRRTFNPARIGASPMAYAPEVRTIFHPERYMDDSGLPKAAKVREYWLWNNRKKPRNGYREFVFPAHGKPPVDRTAMVFFLHHALGLPLKEIGELAGVKEARVSRVLAESKECRPRWQKILVG
ncbi:MAG: hypothetical protein AB7P76_05805 [Candidatus Melainabacteria bacterium]